MVKFVTNASSGTWWPKLEPMLIALHVGQIWNQFWWHHLVVKFWTNTSGTTYNWPNLEPMQVAFYLAGEITQVIDSTPWVRCASGNVCHHYHQNYHHYYHNYHCNHHYHHRNLFGPTRKHCFWHPKKRTNLPELGGFGGALFKFLLSPRHSLKIAKYRVATGV